MKQRVINIICVILLIVSCHKNTLKLVQEIQTDSTTKLEKLWKLIYEDDTEKGSRIL